MMAYHTEAVTLWDSFNFRFTYYETAPEVRDSIYIGGLSIGYCTETEESTFNRYLGSRNAEGIFNHTIYYSPQNQGSNVVHRCAMTMYPIEE